jgi:hypothetical protein
LNEASITFFFASRQFTIAARPDDPDDLEIFAFTKISDT